MNIEDYLFGKEIKDKKRSWQKISDVGNLGFGDGFSVDRIFTLPDTVRDLW